MLLQVSAQHGDPRASGVFSPYHRGLNAAFEEIDPRLYFESLELLTVVLRVSGQVRDFGSEGPERMKKASGRPEITIDLVVPESRWKGVAPDDFSAYLRDGFAQCFAALTKKAQGMKELKDSAGLQAALEQGLEVVFNPAPE